MSTEDEIDFEFNEGDEEGMLVCDLLNELELSMSDRVKVRRCVRMGDMHPTIYLTLERL